MYGCKSVWAYADSRDMAPLTVIEMQQKRNVNAWFVILRIQRAYAKINTAYKITIKKQRGEYNNENG